MMNCETNKNAIEVIKYILIVYNPNLHIMDGDNEEEVDADQGAPIATDTYAHDGGKMRPQLEPRTQVRYGKF